MRFWQWTTTLAALVFGTVVLSVTASLIGDRWSNFSHRTRRGLVAAGALCGVLAVAGLAADQSEDAGPTSTSPQKVGRDDCLFDYLHGIPPERVKTVEEGASGFNVIRADQTKTEPFALLLTERARPLGALRAQFFSDGDLFRIESIVDAACNEVREYSNPARPGSDRRVLQNHEGLRIEFAPGQRHDVLLGATAGINVRFFRVVP